jgi:AcrR family transcriptional regulator
MHAIRPYRHGNLPVALISAARQILDESGFEAVGLRETARRVGVSATAAYRHFASKEELLSSVAAEGFRELGDAMERGSRGATPLTRAGLAYVEFAQKNRGLFRLMFGPILAERAKYPALKSASDAVGVVLMRNVADIDGRPFDENVAAMAAWGLVHGLSHLFVDGFVSAARSLALAEEILAKTRLPRPSSAEAR